YPRVVNQMRMLAAAINEAKSVEPGKIAQKLEGMKINVYSDGEGFMRADDHQFFQPMYLAKFGALAAGQPFEEEKTGWGWKVEAKIDAKDTVVPTTCKMNRPTM